jgi:hypothetical protein
MTDLTVTQTAGAGFFQTGALGDVVPGASSTLNAERAGQTVPAAAVILVGSDPLLGTARGVSVYTQSGGHIVLDVSGFFTR